MICWCFVDVDSLQFRVMLLNKYLGNGLSISNAIIKGEGGEMGIVSRHSRSLRARARSTETWSQSINEMDVRKFAYPESRSPMVERSSSEWIQMP